jgi:TRAP-type C4-dicarboxylate transport system permease small subunit
MDAKRNRLAVWITRVNLTCGFLSGVAMLLMMVAGTADILSSNLDKVGLPSKPVPAAFEFMATMMVVVVFLAIPLAQARRSHIQVELVLNMLPTGLRKTLEIVHHILSAVLFAFIAWFGWRAGLHAFDVGEFAAGLINYPIWPARLVLAFGASLMTVQCLFDLAAVFSARFSTEDRPSHPESTLV